MGKIVKKELCEAARKIQDILDRKNLELVNWSNTKMENYIYVIHKGSNPWEGACVAKAKENKFTKTDKQKFIDKACKWLIKGGYFVNNTETIEDFKQAMEE